MNVDRIERTAQYFHDAHRDGKRFERAAEESSGGICCTGSFSRIVLDRFAIGGGLQNSGDESGNPAARWYLSPVSGHDTKRLGARVPCKPA